MSKLLKTLFILCLVSYQARAKDLNYFSDGINYWNKGKKN
jgi:hypothetical protein